MEASPDFKISGRMRSMPRNAFESSTSKKNPGEMRRFIRIAGLHAIRKSTGNASPRV